MKQIKLIFVIVIIAIALWSCGGVKNDKMSDKTESADAAWNQSLPVGNPNRIADDLAQLKADYDSLYEKDINRCNIITDTNAATLMSNYVSRFYSQPPIAGPYAVISASNILQMLLQNYNASKPNNAIIIYPTSPSAKKTDTSATGIVFNVSQYKIPSRTIGINNSNYYTTFCPNMCPEPVPDTIPAMKRKK